MLHIVGLFKQYQNAETALDGLVAANFDLEHITAIMPDSAASEGPGRGVAGAGSAALPASGLITPAGGVQRGSVAGLPGLLDANTGRLMPGIGNVRGHGPLLAAGADQTVQADASAAPEDLAHLLLRHGIDSQWAGVYAQAVKSGYILLAVQTEDRLADVKNIFNQANSADVDALRREFGDTAL